MVCLFISFINPIFAASLSRLVKDLPKAPLSFCTAADCGVLYSIVIAGTIVCLRCLALATVVSFAERARRFQACFATLILASAACMLLWYGDADAGPRNLTNPFRSCSIDLRGFGLRALTAHLFACITVSVGHYAARCDDRLCGAAFPYREAIPTRYRACGFVRIGIVISCCRSLL